MTEWELGLQFENGAFPAMLYPCDFPEVFNTGMILFGIVHSYEETGVEHFINSAKRAGDWLMDIQEVNGQSKGEWLKGAS